MEQVKKLRSHVKLVTEQGHENKVLRVSVKIPAGVETGQQIRLAGQGEAGFNGGPSWRSLCNHQC